MSYVRCTGHQLCPTFSEFLTSISEFVHFYFRLLDMDVRCTGQGGTVWIRSTQEHDFETWN